MNVLLRLFGGKALCEAIDAGDVTRVRDLLTRGCSPNGKASDGETALMHAAWLNSAAIARVLIEKGARVNTLKYNGETALHHAAARCSDTVRLLLEHGASPNIASKQFGTTPLMVASYCLQPDAIRALIAGGAEVNARNWEGKTALYSAAEQATGLCHLEQTATDAERQRWRADRESIVITVLNILLQSGADVNGATCGRWILTAVQGSDRVTELLRQHGARG